MKEYQHGGDISFFAKKHSIKKKEVIDLSSNINFYKPKKNIDYTSLDISFYPSYKKLYNKLAKNYKIKPTQLELYNGGSSAIFSLFKKLALKKCTIYSPAYLEYKKAADIFGYKLNLINRFEYIYKKVAKNSLVIFVNPSTPDGKYYNFKKLFDYWKKQNCTILVDESFLDFTTKESTLPYISEYKKLYVLKSMTKFYSCAGVRLGILVSNKDNIKKLKEKEPMWKISQFDLTYLLDVLKNKDFRKKSLKKNKKNKQKLIKVLKNCSLIVHIYKNDANFILVKLKNIKAKELQDILAKYKIMIRDCSNFDYLSPSYVRFAVKSKHSIKALKRALKEID